MSGSVRGAVPRSLRGGFFVAPINAAPQETGRKSIGSPARRPFKIFSKNFRKTSPPTPAKFALIPYFHYN
jgi:hypothetical protein